MLRQLAVATLTLCLIHSVDALTAATISSLSIAPSARQPAWSPTRGRLGSLDRQEPRLRQEREGLTLRLRGGKEIPVDMRILHWWLHNPVAWMIVIFSGLCSVYLVPAFPRFDVPMKSNMKAELKVGSSLLLSGAALLLAGPYLEKKCGYWSMGFMPEAQTLLIIGTVLVWHVLGEYVAECRDHQLVEETRDPTLPSFATNYRIFG